MNRNNCSEKDKRNIEDNIDIDPAGGQWWWVTVWVDDQEYSCNAIRSSTNVGGLMCSENRIEWDDEPPDAENYEEAIWEMIDEGKVNDVE